jgi:hypothetical protein
MPVARPPFRLVPRPRTTAAFEHYRKNHARTLLLIELGQKQRAEQARSAAIRKVLLRKVRAALSGSREPDPPTAGITVKELSFTKGEMLVIRKALRTSPGERGTVRFHLYAVLTVWVWGMLETYVGMLLDHLYRLRPELLSTRDAVPASDVVRHRADVVGFLVDWQLDRVGHLTFAGLLGYLKDRLNFEVGDKQAQALERAYFIRNVVAHSAGLVRKPQVGALPVGLRTVEGELRITSRLLRSMLDDIRRFVVHLERHVEGKFFKRKRTASP